MANLTQETCALTKDSTADIRGQPEGVDGCFFWPFLYPCSDRFCILVLAVFVSLFDLRNRRYELTIYKYVCNNKTFNAQRKGNELKRIQSSIVVDNAFGKT